MRKTRLLCICLTAIVCTRAQPSWCQVKSLNSDDGPVGIFANRDEYHNFMGEIKGIDDPQIKEMVPFINDIVLGRPIGFTNQQYNLNPQGTVDLLSDKRIREELEMADFQYEELKERAEVTRKRMTEEVKSLDFSNATQLASTIRTITDSAESDFKDLLLPHQLKRIQQLSLRSQMRRRSLVDMLTSDPLATELEVTKDQKVELRESEKSINEELEQQIAELRKKAQKKLLSKLNGKQRDRLEEMIGDEFDFGPKKPAKVNR